MSITRAMQSGVTALQANSAALSVISNNIANSNTTGYKRVTTNFTDLVSGASTAQNYGGDGVTNVSQQSLNTTGELNSSTTGYSLGIDGQGFFVTSNNSDPVAAGSSMLFTRDGSFNTDTKGYLKNAAGLYLEGWPADSAGNVTPSSTDITKLAPINVTDLANQVAATDKVTFTSNVDSGTAVSDAVTNGTYDHTTAAGAMSTYDATSGVGTKPDSTISMTVSDSLGNAHTVTISLLNLGVDTTSASGAGSTLGKTLWAYEISSPDVDDNNSTHQLSSGTLAFDSDGTLAFDTSTTPPTPLSTTNSGTTAVPFNTDLSIAASNNTTTTYPRWNDSIGAGAQTVALGLSDSPATSTITQLADDSTTTAMTANGTEFGTLTKVEIADNGDVNAIYNNGDKRRIAQVALATFINANGLTPVSGNAFQVSTSSGVFSLKTPGDGGSGKLAADTLEASTVDLAQEFTGLITTQRAYSAASKIITTADQMLQELLQLKQ